MFLNRRNLIAYLLLLIAAVSFVFGRQYLSQEKHTSQDKTTTTLSPLLESITYFSGAFTTTQTTPPITTTEKTAPNEQEEEFNPLLGYLLCIVGAASAIVSVWALRQKAPLLGPDLISVILMLLVWLKWNIPIKLWFLQVIFVFVFLLSIREGFGWLFSKCKLSWCLTHRLTRPHAKPQVALLIYAFWILGVTVGSLFLFGSFSEFSFLFLSFALIAFLFGLIGLWQYGAEIEHFKKQLTRFGKGLRIFIKDEAFSEAEEQLIKIQKEHEEALHTAVTSERFKVELISNVSHDLRTPLTSILGYSELLQKENLSAEGKEQLAKLCQKAGYMNDLVESLFELTKVSSGTLEDKKEKIDLIRLLEQTIGLLDDELTAAKLTVRRNYESEPMYVETDGDRMHCVFANLLGNAIKYALVGTRVHLEVKKTNDAAVIRMTNTASYEMDFDTNEILERFARGDKARSTEGSGLGLTIAKTYTESVGGRFYIRVDGDQFNAIVELPIN